MKKITIGKVDGNDHRGFAQGAASEMFVCADLLERGWYVFRSVSPDASCDLVAMKYGRTVRVEVKTGFGSANAFASTKRQKQGESFDVLAVVFRGGVTYTPNIDSLDGM